MDAMNEKTYEWYEKIIPLLPDDGKFISSSPGMLMEMLNAGSTALGLLQS